MKTSDRSGLTSGCTFLNAILGPATLAYLRTRSSSSPTLLCSLPSTGSLPPADMHVVVSPILKLSLDLASLFQQSFHLSPAFYIKTSHKNNLFCLLHFSPLIPELLPPSRFSRVWLCATPERAAHQAPPSLGFSTQDYWSGLPFPSPRHACLLSCFSRFRLCVALWTAAHRAPLSTGFSRQKYWNGLPFPSAEPTPIDFWFHYSTKLL